MTGGSPTPPRPQWPDPAAGGIPVKAETRATVRAMADALRAHPLARPATAHPPSRAGNGQVVAGRAHRRWLPRSMWDWITTDASGRLVIVDYKTTTDASPGRREILTGTAIGCKTTGTGLQP